MAYQVLVVFAFFLSMRLRCRFCYYYGRRCFSGMDTLAVTLGVSGFSWLSLALVIIYVIASVVPGLCPRPRIYCRYCKEGQMGCPAYRGMTNGATT